MASSAFEIPLRRLRSEMAWLCVEFKRAANVPATRQTQLTCEMAVIRMHDSWARFCREIIILSAFGNTITLSGIPLTRSRPDIDTLGSVIPVLLRLKRSSVEPRWANAYACIDAARNLSIRNFSTVVAAIGATNSPADALRHARNFYAHRGKETSKLAISTGNFVSTNYPLIYDLNAYTKGGLTLIESWVKEFDIVAVASIQ